MRVDEASPGGIELVGGPWTTGERAKDVIVSRTSWGQVAGIDADVRRLDALSAEGPGIAEVRWLLDGVGPGDAVAVAGLSVESTSHPAGFHLAGFGVGVDVADGGQEPWLRIEAGKVPCRPERFEQIAMVATLSVAVLRPADPAMAVHIEQLHSTGQTKRGFRPKHGAIAMPHPEGWTSAVAGWSWSVTNTPEARGRNLRGFSVEVEDGGDGARYWVSNRGESRGPPPSI